MKRTMTIEQLIENAPGWEETVLDEVPKLACLKAAIHAVNFRDDLRIGNSDEKKLALLAFAVASGSGVTLTKDGVPVA